MKIMKIKDNVTNRVKKQIEQEERRFMAANNNVPPTWTDISTWFCNFYKVPEIYDAKQTKYANIKMGSYESLLQYYHRFVSAATEDP